MLSRRKSTFAVPPLTPDISDRRNAPLWSKVAVYYILACVIAWPFFWRRDVLELPTPSFAYMWGPGIAALLALFIFRRRHRRTITMFGNSLVRSILFYLPPIVALGVALSLSDSPAEGEAVTTGLSYVLILPILGFINILGEELGWRGFLQDAVRPLRHRHRYLLIGVLWELWHFTNRIVHPQVNDDIFLTLLISYPAAVLISWIIGEATERSKSIAVAVTLHLWVNALFEYPLVATYIIFGLSTPYWLLLLRGWKRATSDDSATVDAPMSG